MRAKEEGDVVQEGQRGDEGVRKHPEHVCKQWDSKSHLRILLNWCYLLRSCPRWWPSNWGRQVETWLNAAGRGQSQSQDEVVYTQSQSDTHTSVAKPRWSHNPVVWGGFLIVWRDVVITHFSKTWSMFTKAGLDNVDFLRNTHPCSISYEVDVPTKRDGRLQGAGGPGTNSSEFVRQCLQR